MDRCINWAALIVMSTAATAAAQLPAGFVVTTAAEGLDSPIAMDVAADGRWFVAQRGGRIVIVQDGVVQDPPFAEIEVFTGGECGLLGIALDLHFAENHYVYAFASVSSIEQQIIRFREDNGVAVDTDVILGGLPTRGVNHNGGALKVGPDGNVYFAVGDNGESSTSQDFETLAGKVGRIAPDGSAPADNPFPTADNPIDMILALGFRNPFRMCFASDGTLFVDDVGSGGDSRREEVNIIQAGGNYGWPIAEGILGEDNPHGYIDPIVAYFEEGETIAGCAVYEAAQFPSEFHGDFFHVDYSSGGLFRTRLENGVALSHEMFFQTGDGPVDVAVDRDGSLLIVEIVGGRILRLAYTAGTPTPTPAPTASPTPTPMPTATPTASPSPSPTPPGGNDGSGDGICGTGIFGGAVGASTLVGLGLLRRRVRRR